MTIGRIPSVEGGIQPTIVDAKGDLIAATAADTVNRLAVGSNDQVLVADSTQSTGLAWKSYGAQVVAGKNFLINGGMDIWQRGTSFTSAGYTADRWSIDSPGWTRTVSRQLTNDTTNLPFLQYCIRVQRNSGQTAVGDLYLVQGIETVNTIPLAGRTVTLSFYARKGANYSASSDILTGYIQVGTGTDENPQGGYTGQSTIRQENVTLTSTWQRFTLTSASVPSTTTEMKVIFGRSASGTASTNDWYEITGVQLEIGSAATPFSRAGGTIQGELAACQRYYWRNTSTTSTNFGWFGMMGTGASTTSISGFINYPVRMRTVPTSIDFQGISWITAWGAGVTGITAATINTTGTTDNSAIITLTTTGTTAGTLYYILSNNGNYFIGLSAEL